MQRTGVTKSPGAGPGLSSRKARTDGSAHDVLPLVLAGGLHVADGAGQDLADGDVGGVGRAGDEAALVCAEVEADEDALAGDAAGGWAFWGIEAGGTGVGAKGADALMCSAVGFGAYVSARALGWGRRVLPGGEWTVSATGATFA